jgi:Cu(I)/Ag(I) efflux system membrane fusion protein
MTLSSKGKIMTFRRNLLSLGGLLLALAMSFVLAPGTAAQVPGTSFADLMGHYETVRLTLAADSLDGVQAEALSIQRVLSEMAEDFKPKKAGIDPAKTEEARVLLPDLGTAAANLVAADTLESSRDAFYELSKLLVRLRKTASGEDLPVVAYCSMARRSWLQPEGKLGNPYYGQTMPVCGEVVDH